jgi:hypothetical protein
VSKPFYHVRFRWGEPADLTDVKTALSEAFEITVMVEPHTVGGLAFHSREKGEIKFEADTLSAILEPGRAVLYQREAKPFTRRDLALRDAVAKLYDRMSPYRSAPTPEPTFEVEK